jgi:hypothetical protein
MPLIPMVCNASFTSSSLNGLMMASIFRMAVASSQWQTTGLAGCRTVPRPSRADPQLQRLS